MAEPWKKYQKSGPWDKYDDDSLGMMPFINQAIAKTIEAPAKVAAGGAEVIRQALNATPGGQIPKPELELDFAQRGMKALGIQLPEEGRTPQTLPEYTGAGIGEATALLIPGGKAMKDLSLGVGLTGKITKNIWNSMIKNPYLTMFSEASAGAGAGVSRGIAEQQAPDSPLIRSTAEVGGGIVGGVAPSAIFNAPTMISLRLGKNILKKISLPFTEEGATYRAGEFLKSQVVDPSKTAVEVGRETIGDLPPAVAAGEKRIASLYKSLVGQDPVAEAETIETLTNSIKKLEGEMRKLGYGAPELLAEITERRIAALELGMDKRIADAMGVAQKRLDALPVAQRKGAESVIVRNEIDKVMTLEKTKVDKLWKAVPKDLKVGVDKTRATYAKFVDELSIAEKADIPTLLKRNPIISNQKLTETSLNEMQGLRSKLLETSRIARANGEWNKARIADDMADAILEDLGIVASEATTPTSASLKEALAATREFKIKFNQGIIGKILGFGRTGAPAISPELTLDMSIGRMGQKGAVDIDKVVITPEARLAAKRYLTRSFTDYSTDKATGVIKPLKAEAWVKNNEAILDQFPDLRTQLTDALSAQDLANNTRVTMEARKSALRNPKISTSAKFLNSVDMNTSIETILKSDKPVAMISQLVLQARKDASGEALEGLRGGFIEHMMDRATVGGYNELGEQTLSGKTLLNFIGKNENVLKEIFDPDQIKKLRLVGRELAKIEAFEKSHFGKPDIEMKDVASSALRLFSRIGGAQLGRWIAKLTGGGTVQTPGIVSERFKVFANHLSKDRAFQLFHDAILSKDPKLLEALLLPIDKPGAQTTKNLIILNDRINAWLGGTGKRVMNDIMAEIQADDTTIRNAQNPQRNFDIKGL